jgi:hypothetical protein
MMKQRAGMLGTLAAIVIFGLLAGCATIDALRASRENLEEKVRDYQQMLRWQEPQAAAQFVSEPLRDRYLERVAELDKVKIVDYRYRIVDFQEVQKKATVSVEYDYHDKNGVKIKTATQKQHWEFSVTESPSGWKLMSLPPTFP